MAAPNNLASNESIIDEEDAYQPLLRRIAVSFSEPNPTGTLSLSYLTEGAANVLWKIHFHDSNLAAGDSVLLLRTRKNLRSATPMVESKSQFEKHIAPMFVFNPSLLLPVNLVMLTGGVVKDLNMQLCSLEEQGIRKDMRQGVYLPDFVVERYAMLMPDLGHGNGKVIEFKPKWLVQSPSAPRHAERCRTCALNGMRREKGGSGRGDSGFCPLDLLSKDENILSHALSQIWSDQSTMADFVDVFRARVQPALRQIQLSQRLQGDVGLKAFEHPEGKDFSIAMALRDCSVLLKVVEAPDGKGLTIPVMKILDLDLKSTDGGKLEKWANMERELIEEGWYTIRPAPSIQCAMAFQ